MPTQFVKRDPCQRSILNEKKGYRELQIRMSKKPFDQELFRSALKEMPEEARLLN